MVATAVQAAWTRRPALWPLAIILLVGCLVVVPDRGLAQQRPEQLVPYQLRAAQAIELAPQLRPIVSAAAPDAELLIDRQHNRILLQGPPEAHRVLQQALRAMDREVIPAAHEDLTSAPTIKAYGMAAGQLQPAADQLRARYQGQHVQIVTDPRTQQLVVMAPPEVHRELAQQLNRPPRSETPALKRVPAVENLQHALRHITWRELEDAMVQLWKQQIAVGISSNGEIATIKLPAENDLPASLEIDRRHNRVRFLGSPSSNQHWLRAIQALDRPRNTAADFAHFVALSRVDPLRIQHVLGSIRAATERARGYTQLAIPLDTAAGGHGWGGDLLAMIFQQQQGAEGGQPQAAQPPAGQQNQAQEAPAAEQLEDGGPLSDVQIEILPGGVLVIRGRERDVQRIRQLIEQIEQSALEIQPEVEVVPLQHINSQAVVELIQPIYEEFFAPLQGTMSITALSQPNAVLLIGSRERIELARSLLLKLDQPLPPEAQLQIFRLRHTSAIDAEQTVRNFFVERPGVGTDLRAGLGTRVRIIADYRTNSLLVQASPRDLREVALVIERIDVPETLATNEVRVFSLRNTLAADLQPVLQAAIARQAMTAAPGQVAPGQAPATQDVDLTPPSTRLRIIGVDTEGNRIINSGILTDVTITADANLNALVVTAPSESMQLIAELIRQLDMLPEAESQIKVFTIDNGDATTMAAMLQQLFGQEVTVGTGALGQAFGRALGQAFLPGAVAPGEEGALVPLRFAVDPRSNSIIVSGSPGVLNVVEAIIVRLDAEDLRERQIIVYRLQNAPAAFVADALNQLLTLERTNQQLQLQSAQLFLINPLEFFQQQIFVVPEEISNSLVISAAPPYIDGIMEVIRELDRRPPMIMIQVVIAEVTLDATLEMGVELGLQDSLLFDRGLNTVGFNFIGEPLGEETTPQSLATRENFAGQAFSAFNVGRTSAAAGFPGLVLSASSESVNVLIRALQSEGKMQVLGRPQIMTMDNIPASILVGQRVPRITDVTITNAGTTSSVTLDEVGLRLGIIPRVTPDGLVVMDLEASRSSVGAVANGIPVAVQDGVVINSPIFNDTTAITTISARTGQTVVFAGLISKERSEVFRGVPWLSDIPVLGQLFRFDSTSEMRNELLIFLTPHIVNSDNPAEVDRLNMVESERMSWCLADVVEIHGEVPLAGGRGVWGPPQAPVIFPDLDPTAGELVPTPEPSPAPEMLPPIPPGQRPQSPVLPPERSSRRLQTELVPSETAHWQSAPAQNAPAPSQVFGGQPAAYQQLVPHTQQPQGAAWHGSFQNAPATYGGPGR